MAGSHTVGDTVACMGQLRLYAIALDEVRGMFGAPADRADHLREVAHRAFAPAPHTQPRGLLPKLGPIFRRPPATPVISPTQPQPADVEVLLAGGYVRPDRSGATWRVLETLVQGCAWGSTMLEVSEQSMDDLDFALARGGVAANVGLRHLLSSPAGLNLLPVQGLTVGCAPHHKAVTMAAAYRAAMPEVKPEQREVVASLVRWLDSFPDWAGEAAACQRPAPDLLGFWAA
jgi:hypothetical protein